MTCSEPLRATWTASKATKSDPSAVHRCRRAISELQERPSSIAIAGGIIDTGFKLPFADLTANAAIPILSRSLLRSFGLSTNTTCGFSRLGSFTFFSASQAASLVANTVLLAALKPRPIRLPSRQYVMCTPPAGGNESRSSFWLSAAGYLERTFSASTTNCSNCESLKRSSSGRTDESWSVPHATNNSDDRNIAPNGKPFSIFDTSVAPN